MKECIKCGMCNICPVFRVEKLESVSPRGKLILMSEGNKKIDTRIVNDVFKCSVCGLCEIVCPTSLKLTEFWEKKREELFEKKLAPLPIHKKLRETAFRDFNPYGGKPEKRSEWLEFQVGKSKTIYFAGCTASYKLQNVAKSSAKALKELGINFTILDSSEFCCGSPFLRTGQKDVGRFLFEKNFLAWKKAGIEEIITSCPGCYRTISQDYPRFAKELGYEFEIDVMHISSVFAGRVKGKLEFTATYHDPCHLGRHMGIYEEPRKVIKNSGVKIVEMERNRELSLCCGAGGGLRSQFKEISTTICEERIKEILSTGTNIVITSCPFCEYNFIKIGGNLIRVLDLSEIVEMTLSP
ncbi:MAG: heterodisulfide reductase-related iron-sulfur binding cluster [Archaeoglobaceae archaeon]|nr:heterodisulfide reductase-related iron-sulfur binding cluster [Archaeoglobaceae archaeon]